MKSKGKAITLLSVLCVVLAFFLVMSFIRFPVGVKNYNGVLGAIDYDYDLNGGVAYTYELASDSEEIEDIDEVVSMLSTRLSMLGYKAYSVKALKDASVDNAAYDIRIETKNTSSIASDIQAVMSYGSVKFIGGTSEDPTDEIMNDKQAVADAYFAGTGISEDGLRTTYNVALVFTDYGYNDLKEKIDAVGDSAYHLKIMLGEETIMSATEITLTGVANKTVYMSMSSESAARQKALQLKTGGLDYKFSLVESESVTAMLGENAKLLAMIIAGSVVLLSIVAMAVAFKGYGLFAMLAMFFYVVLELGMMIAVPGIAVSVYGVIGMVLGALLTAFGLSVKAKYIKEEFRLGRTMRAAVRAGYNRSIFAVLGACVIAGVVGLIAFIFMGGAVQSFGITLGIGAVVALMAVELISRAFIEICLPLIKNPNKFFGVEKEVE